MALGKLGIIGYGNMGSAIVKGIIAAKLLKPSDFRVFDIDHEKAEKAEKDSHTVLKSIIDVGNQSDTVIIAVKPRDVLLVAKELQKSSSETLVISIAAGVTLRTLELILKDNPVIRVMPNTPCMVGAGMNVIVKGSKANDNYVEKAKTIFGAVGAVTEVPETLMDAVTAISGSGPAYVAIMIDAMTDGGVKVGLPRPTALTLAAQTVLGTAVMILKKGIHPDRLRDMVTSPGGTTIEGVSVLEEHAFRSAIISAVEAAANKSKELGKQ